MKAAALVIAFLFITATPTFAVVITDVGVIHVAGAGSTRGRLSMGGGFAGDDFSIAAGSFPFSGAVFVNDFGGNGWLPGATIFVSGQASGSDLGGSFTIHGLSFILGCASPQTGPFCNGEAALSFSGQAVAPPFPSGGPTLGTQAQAIGPATFGGFFSNFTGYVGRPVTEVISGTMAAGPGIATIDLVIDRCFLQSGETLCWHYRNATFGFPTPEPATLLLVSSVVAALGVRRWRHRCLARLPDAA